MKGDIILVEENHRKAAGVIAPAIIEKVRAKPARYVVSVAGESGSGKSETAKAIADELSKLGARSVVLGQDDYFVLPPRSNDARRRSDPEWLGPHVEVNLDLMARNLGDAVGGAKGLVKPLVDYDNDRVGEERIDLEGVNVVIAEGTYTSLLRHVDTRIFIARSRRDTLEHRLKRNRGGEARDPFIEQVLEREHMIIAGHRFLADFVITKDYDVRAMDSPARRGMAVKNQVQLITYPDSLGGTLEALDHVLLTHFPGVFQGGVHILPPFPSSGDRGFSPTTYLEIEPRFGGWEDIRRISGHSEVMLDLMVNHISRQSEYFRDFLKAGRRSPWADLFITLDKMWPDGKPSPEDLSKMFLRRQFPFSRFTIEDTRMEEVVWTTFGKQDPSDQIDMDWRSEAYRKLMTGFMAGFTRNGVKMVRLDAIGYVVKKIGTSCFFVEPEIFRFLDWIRSLADSFGIELLPEVHAHPATQLKLSEHGFWIYDFILPYMILEALLLRKSGKLQRYFAVRPHRQFTMLDCHDGIPVKPDLDGVYQSEDARRVVQTCVERGANLSLILSAEHKDSDGFDVHQVRCSYYSVLDRNDDAYLSARALQFFAPGIPQVYYVGLLAGENDTEAVRRTGEGREVNRHNYSLAEISARVRTEVVQRLVRLIRFRNEYPAFNGVFQVMESEEGVVRLRWQKDRAICTLTTDLQSGLSEIEYADEAGGLVRYRSLTGKAAPALCRRLAIIDLATPGLPPRAR